MQYQFSFKNMNTSESVINYAKEKISQKVEKYSTKPISTHLTFSIDGHHQHVVHCHVKGGDGFSMDAASESVDMYASIDLLADKLEAQLKKHKEKLKNHKFSENLKSLPINEVTDDFEDEPVDAQDIVKFEEKRKRAAN